MRERTPACVEASDQKNKVAGGAAPAAKYGFWDAEQGEDLTLSGARRVGKVGLGPRDPTARRCVARTGRIRRGVRSGRAADVAIAAQRLKKVSTRIPGSSDTTPSR